MTQLNLSGRQSSDTKRNSATEATEAKDESIKNQTVGALGALAMFAAVIVIGSCSRSSKPVAVQQPIQPMAPVSAPATAVAAPAPAPVAVKAKAKTKRRPATTVSYVNPEYGVSFSFPRQFSLKSGDAAQLSWGDLGPFQMDFVHPGGVTLAGVTLPGNSYPGTDFKSAFVNLSVNPRMTAEACTQFAFPEVEGWNRDVLAKCWRGNRERRGRHKSKLAPLNSVKLKIQRQPRPGRLTQSTITLSAMEPATSSPSALERKPMEVRKGSSPWTGKRFLPSWKRSWPR